MPTRKMSVSGSAMVSGRYSGTLYTLRTELCSIYLNINKLRHGGPQISVYVSYTVMFSTT